MFSDLRGSTPSYGFQKFSLFASPDRAYDGLPGLAELRVVLAAGLSLVLIWEKG